MALRVQECGTPAEGYKSVLEVLELLCSSVFSLMLMFDVIHDIAIQNATDLTCRSTRLGVSRLRPWGQEPSR